MPSEALAILAQRQKVQLPETVLNTKMPNEAVGVNIEGASQEEALLNSLRTAGFVPISEIYNPTPEQLKILSNGDPSLLERLNLNIQQSSENSEQLEKQSRILSGMPRILMISGDDIFESIRNADTTAKKSEIFNNLYNSHNEIILHVKESGISNVELADLDLDNPTEETRAKLQTTAFKKYEINYGEKKLTRIHLGASNKEIYSQFINEGSEEIRYLQKKFDTSPPTTNTLILQPGESLIQSGDIYFEMIKSENDNASSYIKFDHSISPLASVLADNKVQHSKTVLKEDTNSTINATQIAKNSIKQLSKVLNPDNISSIKEVLSNLDNSTSSLSVMFDLGGFKEMRKLFADTPYGCTELMNLVNRLAIRLINNGLKDEKNSLLLPHIEGDGGNIGAIMKGVPSLAEITSLQSNLMKYEKIFDCIFGLGETHIADIEVDKDIKNMILEARFRFDMMMQGKGIFKPKMRFGLNIMNTADNPYIEEEQLNKDVSSVYVYDLPEYREASEQKGVGDIQRLILETGQQMVKQADTEGLSMGMDLNTLKLMLISNIEDLINTNIPSEVLNNIHETGKDLIKKYVKEGKFKYLKDAEIIVGKTKGNYGSMKGLVTNPAYLLEFSNELVKIKKELQYSGIPPTVTSQTREEQKILQEV